MGAALRKISTRMASRGTTRIRQKPNMIHLLIMARRPFRRSNSLGANGLTAMGTLWLEGRDATALILVAIGFFHAFDDQVRSHVDAAGDHEQNHAQDEQDAIVITAEDGLAHFGGDGC